MNLAQMARLMGGRRRRGRIPRMAAPLPIERGYFADISKIVAEQHAILRENIPDIKRMAAIGRAERGRYDLEEAATAKRLLALSKRRMAERQSTAEQLARTYATRVMAWNATQLDRVANAAYSFRDRGRALSVSAFGDNRALRAMANDFAIGNANLIVGIGEKAADDIAALTIRAFQSGRRGEDIEADIMDRFEVDERRAALIARDQIGSLNGQVNAARQQQLGLSKFIWRSLNDSRVRPEHEDLDGKEFSYSDPPSEGLPGEPVNCRCYAEPVFDDLADDE